jgi:hypothetical protein
MTKERKSDKWGKGKARSRKFRDGMADEPRRPRGKARMLAIPYATFCIRCKRDSEKPPVFPLRRAAGESSESKRTGGFGVNSPRVPVKQRRSVKVKI